MPSLRKRVSSYFRQLSFHNEPREKRHNLIENTFINKYLQGQVTLKEGPPIIYGKNPTDLPNYDIATYKTGPNSIIGCYTGPNGGLTTVQRTEKHLSMLDQDIDFIDTQDDATSLAEPRKIAPKKSANRLSDTPLDNTTMLIRVAGQEYNVTNRRKHHNKSHSLGSLSDFKIEIDVTKIVKIAKSAVTAENNNEAAPAQRRPASQTMAASDINKCDTLLVVDNVAVDTSISNNVLKMAAHSNGNELAKSKSEGNPFGHKKRGKITRLACRPTTADDAPDSTKGAPTSTTAPPSDRSLPHEWNRKSEHVFGLSDSLYDKNLVTKHKNGDPIADCFGIIARTDSAILAVADGVNWGEKASVAAKSAIHGCLHYLNKTIFLDTAPFDNLIRMEAGSSKSDTPIHETRIGNTREVFVCLLRAFNCAHDLILENKGMLTTLTVAVILPLKQSNVVALKQQPHKWDSNGRRVEAAAAGGDAKAHTIERNINLRKPAAADQDATAAPPAENYVCCVCNVGDTLAYVYSQKYGIRELTKGSHDINCNRDMRDALGALGPVDGINPELSNLTLSITTIQKGDIVLIASDGLTDNFDPNVCKFTINTSEPTKTRKPSTTAQAKGAPTVAAPPVKPPRKSYKTRSARERSTSVEVAPAQAGSSSKVPPQAAPPKPGGFMRSKTSIDVRAAKPAAAIARNPDGIPYVTPVQRYELTLLLIEDILKRGISGRERQCGTAQRLCENLVSFTVNITNAKRRTLEDADLYFNDQNGVLVEVSNQEKKMRRKRGLENVQKLPGKLDHVTAVAYNVGNTAFH